MDFKEKYTTAHLKEINPEDQEEQEKIEISSDTYAKCEVLSDLKDIFSLKLGKLTRGKK